MIANLMYLMLWYINVILNNLAVSTSLDIANTCLANIFYWKFVNPGTNMAMGTSRFNRTAGFVGA